MSIVKFFLLKPHYTIHVRNRKQRIHINLNYNLQIMCIYDLRLKIRPHFLRATGDRHNLTRTHATPPPSLTHTHLCQTQPVKFCYSN